MNFNTVFRLLYETKRNLTAKKRSGTYKKGTGLPNASLRRFAGKAPQTLATARSPALDTRAGDKTAEYAVFDPPSTTHINTLLKPWAKAADIDKRFSFHTARHFRLHFLLKHSALQNISIDRQQFRNQRYSVFRSILHQSKERFFYIKKYKKFRDMAFNYHELYLILLNKVTNKK